MTWDYVTIAGVPLREAQTVALSDDTLSLSGREMSSITSVAEVVAAHGNVSQMAGLAVPVVFQGKVEHSGFYRVASASSQLRRIADGQIVIATWSMTLERIGSSRDIEIESRVPTIPRLDELPGAQTPSYWHAPAVGITSYWTGATSPNATVSRVSSEGAVQVFTGIPVSVAPRWTVAASDYLLGSSRILLDGIRRVGTFTPPHTAWEIHNGLVRVAGDVDGAITVAAWVGNNWRSTKGYSFTVSGVMLTAPPELSILRNDPEEVGIRLAYPGSPGRVTVDLSLRRGARFVTGVVKRHSAAELGVYPVPAMTQGTTVTGGQILGLDASGNRAVLGSSRVLSGTTVGRIAKPSVTSFDFFLGHEIGATPQIGDAFADLLAQYIASSGERTRVVRR